MMHVQTFSFLHQKKKMKHNCFLIVDLAPYYFHLSESLYYLKKNCDYTVMIKENY